MNSNETRQGLGMLTLGALGVVHGDIGTSPLYTMKEDFNPAHGMPLVAPDTIGAVSVIFWTLMAVVDAEVRHPDPARR
jgi:KUP system potassium uptake protein